MPADTCDQPAADPNGCWAATTMFAMLAHAHKSRPSETVWPRGAKDKYRSTYQFKVAELLGPILRLRCNETTIFWLEPANLCVVSRILNPSSVHQGGIQLSDRILRCTRLKYAVPCICIPYAVSLIDAAGLGPLPTLAPISVPSVQLHQTNLLHPSTTRNGRFQRQEEPLFCPQLAPKGNTLFPAVRSSRQTHRGSIVFDRHKLCFLSWYGLFF